MIGAGAGIAPFIGFLEENSNHTFSLFFGCRNEDDILYEDFLDECVKNKKLKMF